MHPTRRILLATQALNLAHGKISGTLAFHQVLEQVASANSLDQPNQTSGCYDDIADYFGFAKDHPLRFYHPLWVRAIQGHTSENITVSKHGLYDDFQEDYHQVPNYTVYQRHTVPFAMLTHVPVKLEDYDQHLVEGCVFHWTNKEAVARTVITDEHY